jgi:Phosphotransferase enzyme family
MYILAPGIKGNAVRQWSLPDRVFFASGACHILAYAFLNAYPNCSFAPIWIKPARGFTGNHIVVVRGDIAFDYHGYSSWSRILALIERLRPGDGLCHGDVHPDNVIMTADGPRLIDWIGAVRAPAAFDLAISHILLTELVPEVADDPERPRAVDGAAQSEYARLAGMSQAALTAAIEPYLPIVRVRVLLGPAGSAALRERLIQRIEAALRSED